MSSNDIPSPLMMNHLRSMYTSITPCASLPRVGSSSITSSGSPFSKISSSTVDMLFRCSECSPDRGGKSSLEDFGNLVNSPTANEPSAVTMIAARAFMGSSAFASNTTAMLPMMMTGSIFFNMQLISFTCYQLMILLPSGSSLMLTRKAVSGSSSSMSSGHSMKQSASGA